MKNYLKVQILFLWVAISAIFDHFGPAFDAQGAPQKGQNFWFVLNETQYQTADEKWFLCVNSQLLGGYF